MNRLTLQGADAPRSPRCAKAPFVLLIAALIVGLAAAGASACPICGQPTVTLSEQFSKSDVALLVEWVSAEPERGKFKGSTTYEVVEAPRDRNEEYAKGKRLTIDGYRGGKPGNLVFLMGREVVVGEIRWDLAPKEVTETAYQYVLQAPAAESPAETRLKYYLRFLEYPDLNIANDAFAEFVNAPTKDIAEIARQIPLEKLRRWFTDPKTPVNRLAAYGLMLGFAGGPQEAELLKERILDESTERRIGVEGAMFGYLLLTGEAGLEFLEKTKIAAPDAPDGEMYAALQAVRYFWSLGNGKISPERLKACLRLVLDNRQWQLTVLDDLARWKDWTILDALMEKFEKASKDRDLKRKIIVYMIAATKDMPNEKGAKPPAHVVEARRCLDRMRASDPKLVAEGEKFFYLK